MKIHTIKTGKVRVRKNQLQKAGGMAPKLMKVLFDSEWSEWLPIFAWVIEHAEGIIVVDTGDTFRTNEKGYLPKWHPYYARAVEFNIQPHEEIGPQLSQLGIDSEKDVSKVILTHLHTDHAGGMYHFPNAEILIERKEYKNASGIGGILAGYLPHRWPAWLNPTLVELPDRPYGSFEKSLPVTSDGKVTLVATPGHVANHVSVIAEVDGLYHFLAGDTSYTQHNMLSLIPDGIGTDESVATLKKIRQFTAEHPTIYLPSHDLDAQRRLEEKIIVPNFKNAKDKSVKALGHACNQVRV